jgi:CheY-like chemotaxis protein
VVDIGLPLLDGYEVARRLREALGSGILLIAVTGYGQPEDQSRAFAAGFDHHLTKPADPDDLVRLLKA